jgi:hypothetical protein
MIPFKYILNRDREKIVVTTGTGGGGSGCKQVAGGIFVMKLQYLDYGSGHTNVNMKNCIECIFAHTYLNKYM